MSSGNKESCHDPSPRDLFCHAVAGASAGVLLRLDSSVVCIPCAVMNYCTCFCAIKNVFSKFLILCLLKVIPVSSVSLVRVDGEVGLEFCLIGSSLWKCNFMAECESCCLCRCYCSNVCLPVGCDQDKASGSWPSSIIAIWPTRYATFGLIVIS